MPDRIPRTRVDYANGEFRLDWLAGEPDEAPPTSFDPLRPVADDLAGLGLPEVAGLVIDAWQGEGWALVKSAPGPTFPLEFAPAQPPAPGPVR
jgi:hypothetical protein